MSARIPPPLLDGLRTALPLGRRPVAWWLLVVGWVCLNCPQAAFYAAVDWFSQARHFSHQQRLVAEVSALLVQDVAAVRPVTWQSASSHAPAPIIPIGAVLKKIEIFLLSAGETPPPVTVMAGYPPVIGGCPAARVEPPPHGPPRLGMS